MGANGQYALIGGGIITFFALACVAHSRDHQRSLFLHISDGIPQRRVIRSDAETHIDDALDYLLKPIRRETLFPVLDRIFLREQPPQNCLTLKCGSSLVRIPFSQLTYVEVMSKHLYFNLADGQVREVFGSLKEYDSLLLARPEFMRVHRSYIVNMLQVSELAPTGIRTFSGKNVPVSRQLYPQLQKDYMKLLFAQRGW